MALEEKFGHLPAPHAGEAAGGARLVCCEFWTFYVNAETKTKAGSTEKNNILLFHPEVPEVARSDGVSEETNVFKVG